MGLCPKLVRLNQYVGPPKLYKTSFKKTCRLQIFLDLVLNEFTYLRYTSRPKHGSSDPPSNRTLRVIKDIL